MRIQNILFVFNRVDNGSSEISEGPKQEVSYLPMNRSVIIIAIAILAGFAFLGSVLYLTRTGEETASESITVADNRVDDAPGNGDRQSERIQIARLQAEVNNLKRQLATGKGNADVAVASADSDLSRPERLPPEELAEMVKAHDIRQAAQLDHQLNVGPEDREWEAEVQETAAQTFTKFDGKATLRSVDCSDRFCRADINMDDVSARGTVLKDMQTSPPFDTNGFIYVKSEDDPQTIVYFTRGPEQSIQDVAPLPTETN